MPGHVSDDIVDLLEGRLDPATEKAMRRHIASCSECAADLEWARHFRDRVAEEGLRHAPPEIVLLLAALEGRSQGPPDEQDDDPEAPPGCVSQGAGAPRRRMP